MLLCAAAITYSAPDIILPWHPFGTFGFDADPGSGLITNVRPNSAASDAGLRVSDVIDLHKTGATERRYVDVLSAAPPGQTAHFEVITGNQPRSVTLTARARARTFADNITDIVLVITQVCFVLIAASLVFVRPSVMMWAFFVYALSTVLRSVIMLETLSLQELVFFNSWTIVTGAGGWIGLVIFALRFPNESVRGWRSVLEKGVLAAGVIIALVCIYAIVANLGAGHVVSPNGPIPRLLLHLSIAGFVVGIAVFIASYAQADEHERPRLGWVLLGFLVGYGGVLTVEAVRLIFSAEPQLWLVNMLYSLNIAVPIAVAYAVVRYRVIEVRFFLDRALVYGALTTVVISAVAFLHRFLSTSFERYHFGVVGELAFVLALGFGLNRIHAFMEALVDRLVFRSVHDAEKHLNQVGASMLHAQSPATIDKLLSEQSVRALHLSSSAVFHLSEDGSYRRTQSSGWPTWANSAINGDEELVLALKAQEDSVDAAEYLTHRGGIPEGDAAPILATPLIIRRQLQGFALFGAHTNGAAIDPDEREILKTLTDRAAIAYDQSTSLARDAELARLDTELAQLRSENALLRSLGGIKSRSKQ